MILRGSFRFPDDAHRKDQEMIEQFIINDLPPSCLMIRLSSLKELGLKSTGTIWIVGSLIVHNDQLYVCDGELRYRVYLQLGPQGSQLLSDCGIALGTNQIFEKSIIVSELLYLNIRNVCTHYDYYLSPMIIHRPQEKLDDSSSQTRILDQGTFVLEIQAKSEILCKGSVDFIIQATIRSNDFSWLPSNYSYQALKCCVCTVFIIFHGERDLVKLTLLHSFLHIGQSYIFGNLRPSKIRFPNGEKKKILSYNDSKSWFKLYDGQLMQDHVLDQNFQMELTFPVPPLNVIKTRMISYSGMITKVLDGPFRFFEMDGKHQVFLGYCLDQSLDLITVGAKITLSHAHIFTMSDIAVFVGCHFTNLLVGSTQGVNECQYIPRRKIWIKYPSIRDFLISRNFKTALNIILGDKTHDLSSVIQELKNCTAGKELNRSKEPNLFDFMTHNSMEECPVVFGHDNLPKILTPSDLIDIAQERDNSECNPQKGYHSCVISHEELGFGHPFLLGILDSNETGHLRLRDSFGHSVMCCVKPSDNGLLSLRNFRQLALVSEFQIVIEKYGYSSLEELTTKVYIRLTLSSAFFWDIFVKRPPLMPFDFEFQLMYIRPVMWDLNPGLKTLTSCTLEGLGRPIDSINNKTRETKKMWVKVSGLSAALVPFLKKGQLYFIFGDLQKLDNISDIIVHITREENIEEARCQSFEIMKENMAPEMPVITLQTFVLGYQALKNTPGLTEELISIRAVLISKEMVSSESWESPCRLSSKELSATWNIGIGFSDRILVLQLKDELSHEEFSVYYDTRKLALQCDILPGCTIQMIRLGLQVSKARKLYGLVLPITSIEILSLDFENDLISAIPHDPPQPLMKLYELNQFTPTCRVLCSISQIINISLKRQNRAEYGKSSYSEISGSAILKLEDGTQEATGHINSIDVLFSILSVDPNRRSILIDATKRSGEIGFSSDSEKSDTSSNELLTQLAISACSPSLKILKLKFKYLGTDYKIRSFNSKDEMAQIVCPPTLGLQIEGHEALDTLCVLHQALQRQRDGY